MRSLIIFAFLFALANATYWNRNNNINNLRFRQLINRYQSGILGDQFNQDNNWFGGYDDVDDYNDITGDNDYDDIRSNRLLGREQCMLNGQCPRYMDDILDIQDNEFDTINDYSNDQCRGVECLYNEDNQEFGTGLTKEVSDANKKLATLLYKQCKEEKDDKNTVVSPVSVQLALAALNQGARGNTKREIGRAVAGRLQKQERRQVFRTLIRQLRQQWSGMGDYSSSGLQTKIKPVTGIFISQTTPAQQLFVQLVRSNLGTTVKHCNFHHQPQQCRRMINNWMSTKTQHKFNHIVPQDSITDNTKMILVNSLDLKARWGQQMRNHVTKEAKFYPLDSKKVKIVEVLETQGRFKYYEDEMVKIVGVPTQQHELTLYVIVPKYKDGLTDIEKLHLQDDNQLRQILRKTDNRVRNVGVQLPKFQIKHKIDVRRSLRRQGVEDAFDPKRADFSGICGGYGNQFGNQFDDEIDQINQIDNEYDQLDNIQQYNSIRRNPFSLRDEMQEELTGRTCKLHLNKLIHQASIKITEQGIKATTGTEDQLVDDEEFNRIRYAGQGAYGLGELNTFDDVVGFNLGESTNQKIVKANRAFAFVLKHNPTNQITLIGRVIDAAQKKVNSVQQTINTVDQL